MNRTMFFGGVLVVFLGACEFRVPDPPTSAWFVERENELGVPFVTRAYTEERRFDFPEIMLGGVGLADVDNDGDLDLALVQGGDLRDPDGSSDQLWRAEGPWSFRGEPLEGPEYGMGAAFGDVNDDGWVDLYVTNVGPNRCHLNEAGRLVPSAMARDAAWGASASFGDPDGDGDLDLFVANYVAWSPATDRVCSRSSARDYCQPASYSAPSRDTWFENDGRGGLADRSDEVGLGRRIGYGLGVVHVDLDADGRAEVFVANDGSANHLWRFEDGRFVESGLRDGCALGHEGKEEAGMGVAAFDADLDGAPDLFSVHLRNQTNTLYVNRGDGTFLDRTAARGLGASSLPFTGFGVRHADFDFDGFGDLVIANGRVIRESPFPDPRDPYAERDVLYRSSHDGRYAIVEDALPGTLATSRGLAAGDLDGDGDLDLVMTAVGRSVRLLENVGADDRRWIGVDVRRASGAVHLGARVTLVPDPEADPRHAWIARDGSYLSSSEPVARFALPEGSNVAHSVVVRLPDGREFTWEGLAGDRVHRLTPGE